MHSPELLMCPCTPDAVNRANAGLSLLQCCTAELLPSYGRQYSRTTGLTLRAQSSGSLNWLKLLEYEPSATHVRHQDMWRGSQLPCLRKKAGGGCITKLFSAD